MFHLDRTLSLPVRLVLAALLMALLISAGYAGAPL